MTYGKTLPIGSYCTTCNSFAHPRRRNKATEKSEFMKYCKHVLCRVVRAFKPKQTRHSK